MELLPQALADGVMLGAIYIIIAIAFSLVYGVMHVIDFAVGEWIMLGAFAGFHLNQRTHVDPFLLLPVVFVGFAALGYVLQPLIQRVLSGHKGNPLLMGLVFTFGLSLMFRGSPRRSSASTATRRPPASPPDPSSSRRAASS